MDDADLAYAGLARLAGAVRDGEISSRELTEFFLARIERHDPTLNAFRCVMAEKALAEADQADARRKAGGERPLLGVPIAVKDDTDVAGEITAHGTSAYDGPAAADAELVRRLRSAGAIIVGKTNVPELEIIPATETPTFGVTRNPWDLDRTSGGSSGGSGTAVAAGLVPAAVASDGAGSIRIPAGACGLFGFKPQRGRVPTAPKRDPWRGLSVWGCLTRNVADSALFMDVISDGDPGFTAAAQRDAGRLRIAVSRKSPPGSMASIDAEQHAAIDAMVGQLRDLGHEVFDADLDYGLGFTNAVVRYFVGIRDDARAMPRPERLWSQTRGYARIGGVLSPLIGRALAAEESDRRRVNRIFERADLVITPQFTKRPIQTLEYAGVGTLRSYFKSADFVPFNAYWNHLGQPAVTLPAGFSDDGFPLAVQLLGPMDSEPLLYSLGAQLQAAVDWTTRRPPGFE